MNELKQECCERLVKGRMSALKGDKENANSGKQKDSVPWEMLCSFRHDESKRGKVTRSSSPAPRPQTQKDKQTSFERRMSRRPRAIKPCRDYVVETVRTRHVIFAILPFVNIT